MTPAPNTGASAMEYQHPEMKAGDRVTVEVTGTIFYHSEHTLSLKIAGYYSDVRLDNSIFRVKCVRGPVLNPGDRAYSASMEETVEIVLRDDDSNAYVVRRPNGRLFVHADDDDLTAASDEPTADQAAKDAAGIVERAA